MGELRPREGRWLIQDCLTVLWHIRLMSRSFTLNSLLTCHSSFHPFFWKPRYSALTAVSFPDSDPLLTNSVDKGLWFSYYLSISDKICIYVSVLLLATTIFIHHHETRVQDNETNLSISSKDLCPGPWFFTKWCKKAPSFGQQKEQISRLGTASYILFFVSYRHGKVLYPSKSHAKSTKWLKGSIAMVFSRKQERIFQKSLSGVVSKYQSGHSPLASEAAIFGHAPEAVSIQRRQPMDPP